MTVISFGTGAEVVPPIEQVQDVVKLLEEALELARNGNLRGIAVVKFNDGNFSADWAYDCNAATSHGLAAGIVALQWRFGRAMCRNDFVEPPPPNDSA